MIEQKFKHKHKIGDEVLNGRRLFREYAKDLKNKSAVEIC